MESNSIKNSAIITSIITITSPLQLVKMRLQTAQELLSSGKIKQNYKSILDCVRTISQKQGVKSLWKGNGIGVLRFFPNQSINLQTRTILKKYFPDQFGFNVLIAVLGGWSAASILYPFDILRMSLGSSTQKQYKITHTLRTLVQNHGAKYFYKGFLNSMVGTAIFRGSFNGFYDSSKSKAKTLQFKALIAYTCAVVAGGICYPLDSIRRRRIIINSNDNIFSFADKIWKREGLKGFYKGSKLILAQSFAGAVILILFDSTHLPIHTQTA